eukprot:NODE_2441_length_1176_cov_40.129647_g2326_i0.p1 GENE.NODE_2441_length_1176_cov_40.129647_g2326_i0~~NODE_2441_length_1176_cov_40.129647_g2326_i0.p1  ORF type:complete len:386 (-),score=88.56 NODE_2441_length_1176_cov_40.129647_g2326_i0:18-1139(-)
MLKCTICKQKSRRVACAQCVSEQLSAHAAQVQTKGLEKQQCAARLATTRQRSMLSDNLAALREAHSHKAQSLKLQVEAMRQQVASQQHTLQALTLANTQAQASLQCCPATTPELPPAKSCPRPPSTTLQDCEQKVLTTLSTLIELPMPQTSSSEGDFSELVGFAATSNEHLGAGLGIIVLFLSKAAELLGVPLPNEMWYFGSLCTIGPQRSPLFWSPTHSKEEALRLLQESVRLLNGNIHQLCFSQGYPTAPSHNLLLGALHAFRNFHPSSALSVSIEGFPFRSSGSCPSHTLSSSVPRTVRSETNSLSSVGSLQDHSHSHSPASHMLREVPAALSHPPSLQPPPISRHSAIPVSAERPSQSEDALDDDFVLI